MSLAVNFANEHYFRKALELAEEKPESRLSVNMAFFRLLKGSSFQQIENVIRRVQREYPMFSGQQIYEYIQNPQTSEFAGTINGANVLCCAYDCLQSGVLLGNEIVPGRGSNSADWIAHCMWEAKACGILAGHMGLDRATAMKLGMLHDVGRRKTHSFDHIVRGFEMLTDEGYDAEALGCLSHSFMNGGRCANNDPAAPGFYVDEEGRPAWQEDCEKDQITRFLGVYEVTDYDRILNMSDLMATSRGIVEPAERIRDIATRRVIDPVNRGYFLAELVNQCRSWAVYGRPMRDRRDGQNTVSMDNGRRNDQNTVSMNNGRRNDQNAVSTENDNQSAQTMSGFQVVRFTKDCTITQMEELLDEASAEFWKEFRCWR